MPKPYKKTVLSPGDEQGFQQWYGNWARKLDLDPNPDDPRHYYDYRAAYAAGAEPTAGLAEDGRRHWPSQFKAPDHPHRFVDGVDTITGKPQQSKGSNMAKKRTFAEEQAAKAAADKRAEAKKAAGWVEPAPSRYTKKKPPVKPTKGQIAANRNRSFWAKYGPTGMQNLLRAMDKKKKKD